MLTAKEIMTSPVITARHDLPVRDLARLLFEHRISGGVVVNDQDQVIGVATESDLIDRNKKVHIPTVVFLLDSFVFLENPEKLEKDIRKMAAVSVGDLCSRELVFVTPETPLDEIATLMAEKKVHTLPVMEGEKLVGVIGKADIIRTIAEGS